MKALVESIGAWMAAGIIAITGLYVGQRELMWTSLIVCVVAGVAFKMGI